MKFSIQLGVRLGRLWFRLRHAPQFRHCGRSAHICSSFRVDGPSNIELGEAAFIQRGAWLYCQAIDDTPARLQIGVGCVLGYNNHLTSVRSVVLEDHVLTANNVYITDNMHSYEDVSVPIMHQAVVFKAAVVIGRGSWIGENVSILGASIGRNCVIGANSVVTHNIPDYSVAVGAPAAVVRQYNPGDLKWVAVKRNSDTLCKRGS